MMTGSADDCLWDLLNLVLDISETILVPNV